MCVYMCTRKIWNDLEGTSRYSQFISISFQTA